MVIGQTKDEYALYTEPRVLVISCFLTMTWPVENLRLDNVLHKSLVRAVSLLDCGGLILLCLCDSGPGRINFQRASKGQSSGVIGESDQRHPLEGCKVVRAKKRLGQWLTASACMLTRGTRAETILLEREKGGDARKSM